jgi:hypothetical protein
MGKTDDNDKLVSLARGLVSLGKKLPPEQAKVAFQRILAFIDNSQNIEGLFDSPSQRAALGLGVESIWEPYLGNQELIDVLKLPFCVDGMRAAILKLLAKRAKRDLGQDNVWTAVTWAEEQGLNVRSQPLRPEPR